MNDQAEEYLTVDELSERIKFSRQSIYNMVHEKILVINVHYLKPRPKKLLFMWSAIRTWMENPSGSQKTEEKQSIEKDICSPKSSISI
jgi:predicted DNA-binding transcriptional regulator AlpA